MTEDDTTLEYYEKVYYAPQTVARGLLSENALRQAFERFSIGYWERLGPFLPKDKAATCLSLGCGYGAFLYFLQKHGFQHTSGVDLDPEQVRLARLLGLNAHVEDALREVKSSDNLGLIEASDLIEHLDKNRAVLLLEACHSALRQGGIIIVQCPCADGFTGAHDAYNDLTHRWAATSNMLRQLLRTVGFSKVEIIDPSVPPFPRLLRRRLIISVRKFARLFLRVPLVILGIRSPQVWANSQLAVGWKELQSSA
jgi:SAM-dependent methyltransferase